MSYPCTYCLESTAGIVEATLCNSLRHLAAQSAEAGLGNRSVVGELQLRYCRLRCGIVRGRETFEGKHISIVQAMS